MKRAKLMEYINQALDDSLAGCNSENPLEAWSRFMDRLEVRGRASIGDDLERQGRNRYTGKEVNHNDQSNVKRAALLGQENPEW